VLLGTHTRKVDAKGRVTIPAAFRKTLEEGRFAIAPDPEQDDCLLGFDVSDLETEAGSSPEAVRRRRVMLSNAVTLEPDSNGRVVLPTVLRDFARIEQNVVFVGFGDSFRIHRSEGFEPYEAPGGPAVHAASAWTGMESPAERARYLTTVGPHILRSFSEWIEAWEARRGNEPPDLLFPEELLADLRGLHSALGELIEDVEAGRFSDDALNTFVARSIAWLKGYKKAIGGAVADTVYGAPAMIGVVGFAQSVGMLDHTAASLATGILAGSMGTGLAQRRKSSD
jgi:transcriptional regulator MraZ